MRFGLVFLDPPYGKGLAADSAARLSRAGLLRPEGTVVVEESFRAPEAAFPEEWELSVDRRYGDTRVRMFRVSS
jgi:16S rRNA (guanine966-N2)-methyltransferase